MDNFHKDVNGHMISSIGIVFIGLGIYHLIGFSFFSDALLFGVSTTGFIFVVVEWLGHWTSLTLNKKNKILSIFKSCIIWIRSYFLFISMIPVIAFQCIPVIAEWDNIEKYTTVLTMITIGLTIHNISKSGYISPSNNDHKSIDYTSLSNQLNSLQESLDQLQNDLELGQQATKEVTDTFHILEQQFNEIESTHNQTTSLVNELQDITNKLEHTKNE